MTKITKLREKLSLLTKKSVAREIEGQSFNFYPISVGMLFQLRTAMTPLLKTVRGLFQPPGNDGARTIEKVKEKDGSERETTHLGAASLEILQFREKERDRESREMVEGLLSEDNKVLFGRVLADSLRDELGPNITDDEARDFMGSLDLPVLAQFIGGFIAANVRVFGPLADRAEAALRQKLESAVAQAEGTPPSPSPQES